MQTSDKIIDEINKKNKQGHFDIVFTLKLLTIFLIIGGILLYAFGIEGLIFSTIITPFLGILLAFAEKESYKTFKRKYIKRKRS